MGLFVFDNMTPMTSVPTQGGDMGMQSAINTADPRALIQQPVGVSGPSPEDTSNGIIDSLKQVVGIMQAIAGTNSQVADEADAVQKLCIQMAMKTQSQAGSPPQSTMY